MLAGRLVQAWAGRVDRAAGELWGAAVADVHRDRCAIEALRIVVSVDGNHCLIGKARFIPGDGQRRRRARVDKSNPVEVSRRAGPGEDGPVDAKRMDRATPAAASHFEMSGRKRKL